MNALTQHQQPTSSIVDEKTYTAHINHYKAQDIYLWECESIHRDEYDFHTIAKINGENVTIAYCSPSGSSLRESHHCIMVYPDH